MSTPVQQPPESTPAKPPSKSVPIKRPSTPAPQLSSLQIVFGSILAISLLLAINFSGRIAAGQRIDGELNALQATIDGEQIQATAYKAQLDFVGSDAFVDQWAREQGKMIKNGEKLIVPVPGQAPLQPTPTPYAIPVNAQVQHADTQNWQLWWGLFFDGPPPAQGTN